MDEANGAVEEREKKEEEEDQAIDNIPDGEFEEMPRMEQADMHCPPNRSWVKPFRKKDGCYVKGFCRKKLNAVHEKFRDLF